MSQLINFQILKVKGVTAKFSSNLGDPKSGYLDITITSEMGKTEITLFAGGNPETVKLLRELAISIDATNHALEYECEPTSRVS